MEEDKSIDSVFLLQHPLASPKDPPVIIQTLPRHRQQIPVSQVPPTPNSITYSFSPSVSPIFGPKSSRHNNSNSHRHHNSTGGGAVGISSKALNSHPAQLSLARDLTTRLWQREAELHTMKELYDAKIRRLTEMLQDAGVSPTEVENNLAVVVEETDGKQPLFDQLSTTSDHLVGGEAGIVGRRKQTVDEESPVSNLFDEECSSIILDERQDDIDGEEDLGGVPSESLSSSDSLSFLSSNTTQLTRPDGLSRHPSESTRNTESPTSSTFTSKRRSSNSQAARPFSPTASEISASSCSVNMPQYPDQLCAGASPTDLSNNKVEAKALRGSQSPIPSFIADSFAVGTFGMRTLREKWTIASGALSWSKQKPEQKSEQCATSTSSYNNNVITSPSGLFIRNDGIINDKKPAIAEACVLPPIQDDLILLPTKSEKDKERDIWTNLMSPPPPPPSNRKPRPMSEIGTPSSHSKYSALTMARDIPRPPITRIHDFLQRPDSYNPSPLHFRAISIAANLIDTGAITPAKLYAKRTQTMIAKWTLGLIMNTKPSRSTQSLFPVIRESLSLEQEELVGRRSSDANEDGMDQNLLLPPRINPAGMEMISTNDRRSGALNPTELPRALSYKSHSAASSFVGSAFSHTSSLLYYQPNNVVSTQSVVELSDISSASMSVSPSLSCLGEVSKPLTDRYGFLVNARPMAVQQGLIKLNEAHAFDDLDTPSFNRTGMNFNSNNTGSGDNNDTYECLRMPTGEVERPSSPPPAVSALYIGLHASNMGGLGVTGSFAAGNATTSTTTSAPISMTSPILSTTARPTSTLSPPTTSGATITTLLSQIKVLHDSVQTTQKEKWDAFLRKRRRRVHMGETNGGAGNISSTNIGSPLFGNLMLSLEDQEQDDEDVMYWTSVCLIGIATIGKGSDWEEFRDLIRGGIPVAYRNKIWQEVSGALDMRQPGYYKELLSRQSLESCQCWGDIELDLHRTFPTNVLFGPGGQGIEKLKNILIAYSLHNPTVGYCQGMNLLAGTLLLTNNSEEEAFWILTSMLARHLPEDYFTQQLLSPQADQRVLKELIQEIMPRLNQHFQDMHVDLTAVTFSWFLTLFTDCLPVETLLRVWDVFFVEGMIVVFKIAVAILWMNEKEIMKCRNGAAVYCYMKQMTLSMNQADKLIKVAFVTLKSYIHPEKIEVKRQRHQKCIRQELLQEQQMKKMRTFTCVSPPTDKKKGLQN
ncbi:hypothetical protein BGZ80_010225 [Entomortierella chlamydospora]|uniref:Rab-GAP TBC domain-containing protein n=1 Tax=Entomortierella chlamydospora TaxID=101097 RepID=A0A9P6N4B6_9FUNG|nr:hypothetical protein BGZ79_000715 [Entomortierella chlamydospora]KAG0023165.1 hypothetical protein BGZ80_010225 [Entomortierella chlamydospora]